jgi:hypothetical protein
LVDEGTVVRAIILWFLLGMWFLLGFILGALVAVATT